MKIASLIIVMLTLGACYSLGKQIDNDDFSKKTIPEFQTILDSAELKGAILIYDLDADTFYSNDFEWSATGQLPASTFKIANSIIALETKVVENERTLFKWNGEERRFRSWQQDLIFRDAFHYSCVPCYQEVARDIGVSRMNEYLDKMKFGSMQVDASNLDMFWLQGESAINPFEQIDFLKRLYLSQLPISARTSDIIKNMMIIDQNDEYRLSGKTGWSVNGNDNNGWFVGYVEANNNVYIFATNIEPINKLKMDNFASARKELTFEALKQITGLVFGAISINNKAIQKEIYEHEIAKQKKRYYSTTRRGE